MQNFFVVVVFFDSSSKYVAIEDLSEVRRAIAAAILKGV